MTHRCFQKLLAGGEFAIKDTKFEVTRKESGLSKCSLNSNFEDVRHSFIVMEKSGHSLVDYISERKSTFSLNSVCQVGIGLIKCFQILHSIGKIHNNLNLETVFVEKVEGYS